MNRKRRFSLTENMGVVINSDFFKRNTDIVILDLSYGYISEIPEEILLLENLEFLSIANTQISFLPIELGSLRYLENIVTDNSALEKNKLYLFVDFSKKNSLLKLFQEAMKPRMQLQPFSYIKYETKIPFFNVFSWNILSNRAVRPEYYPLCQKKYLDHIHREKLIISKTLQLKPDIICFQEFELRLCQGEDSKFIENFTNIGYKWNFAPKARIHERKEGDKGNVHGQLTLYNTKKFDLIDSCLIEVRKSDFVKDKTPLILACDDVALFTLLKSKEKDFNLLVINVHMFYKEATVRFAFASAIMQEANKFVAGKVDKYETVVMGDFNDLSNSKSISPYYESNYLRNLYDEKKYEVVTCQEVYYDHIRLDHVLASSGLHCSALLKGMDNKEVDEMCPYIPSQWFPSDHHPVGASFYL